jgi:hypothetical protein
MPAGAEAVALQAKNVYAIFSILRNLKSQIGK